MLACPFMLKLIFFITYTYLNCFNAAWLVNDGTESPPTEQHDLGLPQQSSSCQEPQHVRSLRRLKEDENLHKNAHVYHYHVTLHTIIANKLAQVLG